jgi:hypothetical protein
MNSLLDRLSIGAAILLAAAAVADLGPVARIVPMADGLEIVIDLNLGDGAPALFAGLIEELPTVRCAAARLGQAT